MSFPFGLHFLATTRADKVIVAPQPLSGASLRREEGLILWASAATSREQVKPTMRNGATRGAFPLACAAAVLTLLAGCGRPGLLRVQGYVEGEFVYISSPLSGPLQKLSVQRGDQVQAGDPLFELDRTVEKAVLDQDKASLTFTTRTTSGRYSSA